ncbi:MAG: hypothetical protein ABSB19_18855, partial [Methylomonas sp.]
MRLYFAVQKFNTILILFCAALWLSACSSKPKKLTPEEQAEHLASTLDNGGYKSAGNFSIASSREVWMHDSAELEVVMTAPETPGSYPLLIYLPSLGEDAGAGRLWREAWAKAGYAVFSMQPRQIGQALKEIKQERDTSKRDGGDEDQPEDENKDAAEEKSWFFGKKTAKRSGNV